MNNRILRLKETMRSNKIGILTVIPGNSFFYLTGMRIYLHGRPIIFFVNADGRDAFLMPELEIPSAKAAIGEDDFDYFTYTDHGGYKDAMKSLAGHLSLNNSVIGTEYQNMRVFEENIIKEAAQNIVFEDVQLLLERQKNIKESDEVANIKEAARITDLALEDTIKKIRPGMTENKVLNELMIQLLRFGGQEPFKVQIVVSGPRSAFPHSKASDRVIEDGDIVMIDTGATYKGYPCDLTRTFAMGHIDSEMADIYEIVKSANAAVVKGYKPSMTAEDVDALARGVIEAAGYGEYFIHRTGHGLGIGGHEGLSVVKGNKTVLQPGMVFTDEPGIYIPGKGGIRVEDNVHVTLDRLEVLTGFPRELRIL